MKFLSIICMAVLALLAFAATTANDGGTDLCLDMALGKAVDGGVRQPQSGHWVDAAASASTSLPPSMAIAAVTGPDADTPDPNNASCPADANAEVEAEADADYEASCPADGINTTVFGSFFRPQGTPSWRIDGWWLDATTWVTCSPGHEACVGHLASELGHTHPVVVVLNDSSNESDGNRLDLLKAPKTRDGAFVSLYHPWWRMISFVPQFVRNFSSVEDDDALLPRAAVAAASSSTEKTPLGEALRRVFLQHWQAFTTWWSTPPASTSVMLTVNWFFAACTLFWMGGCFYAASQPRLHGGKKLPGTTEDLPYWRRLLATFTLGLACLGASVLFSSVVVYSALAVWFYRGSSEGCVAAVCLLALGMVYLSPLKVSRHGVPIERFSHPILRLWRDYFGFTCEFDAKSTKKGQNNFKKSRRGGGGNRGPGKGERKRRRKEAAAQTYVVAQIPHGIMPFGSLLGVGMLADAMGGLSPMGGVVADALLKAPLLRRAVTWFGVRRASSASIVQMFRDGFKAVGVVTGGIAEMFVSWTSERIVAPRPNLARLALEGGHDVIIAFVYGVSRTHKMTFAAPGLSKKLGFPVMMGHGAFANLPFRETLKMVISKPIEVDKVVNPTDDDIVSLRKRVEAELARLYYQHLPEWETRPLEIVRGETSAEELQVLREKALAGVARH